MKDDRCPYYVAGGPTDIPICGAFRS